jgi:hypothetical protein
MFQGLKGEARHRRSKIILFGGRFLFHDKVNQARLALDLHKMHGNCRRAVLQADRR